ncbi:MAG: GNAT family N-acetyltransferase [Candidatus Omnitrophica bacterium]|nr:GNAT family N-acetyltransferase [Candidatus Omnitrophota bacterium]
MSSTLREYKKSDARGVKDLILSILTKEYPFDKSAYSESDLDKIGEVYGGRRDSFFVIEEDGVITGTAGVKEESCEEALLRRFFVHSAHRRKGYGTQLLKKGVDFCRSKGYKRLYFRCTDRMVDAMRLCMKEGFREVETLEISGFKIHKLVLAL